jgi:Tetratricopeptide repeat.
MKFFFEEIVLKNKLKKLKKFDIKSEIKRCLYHISQVYKQLGDEKKARDYFLKAKAVDPDL